MNKLTSALRTGILIGAFLLMFTNAGPIGGEKGRVTHDTAIKLQISIDDLEDMDPNQFVDMICTMVDQMILNNNLDPFQLAAGDFLGLNYEGWISGISSIKRLGDASVINEDGTLAVTTLLQMTNLAGNFSFWYKILAVTISGGASANIENVDMKLAIRIVHDKASGTTTPYVDDFQITDIGQIDVQVFGLGPFDYLADFFIDAVVNLVKYIIPVIFDPLIQEIIQQVLNVIFNV